MNSNDSGPLDEAFRAVAEAMFDACSVCRAMRNEQGEIFDFRVEYVNQRASVERGIPSDQLLGKSLTELSSAYRTSGLVEALRRVVETGEPLSWERATEEAAEPAHGPLRYSQRLFDVRATKNGERVVVVWRDATAVELAEIEHKRGQRLLRLVTDTIDDVFWAAAQGIGESLYVSPAYDKIWGRPRSELKSNPRAFVDSVVPQDRERVLAHLRQLHEQHRGSSAEYRVMRPNGELRWIHERGFWAEVEPGEEPTIVGVCTDITDRKLAEQELRTSKEHLQSLLSATHAVLESRDFRHAATRILDIGCWNTGAKAGCIALREGEHSCEVISFGPMGNGSARAGSIETRGILQEVLRENTLRTENDAAKLDGADPILASLANPRNVLLAPFSFEGQVKGVIALADKDADFQEHDARQLRGLGEVTALSLQRERYVEQLLATERLLTTTGRMASVGGWELDCASGHVSWTTITREIHDVPDGYEPSLQAGIAFYHPEDRPYIQAAVEAAVTLGTPFDLELRLTTFTNEERWIHTQCTPVLDGQKVSKLIGAFQDVTRRKTAERALIARERFLALITENMFDMVALVGRDGRFTYVSPSHEQLGHDPDSILGCSVLDFVHPQDRELVQGALSRAWASTGRSKVEYRHRCADGNYVWLESIGQVLPRDGDAAELIVSSRDVSDLKRFQASLHAEKETAQRYLDVAAVMLLGMDLNGCINIINRRGCEILGATDQAELSGQSFLRLIPEDEQEQVGNVLRALLRGNVAGHQRFESGILTVQGKQRRIVWSNALIRDGDSQVIGTLSSGEDVTERKEMEAQLAKADRLSSMGLLAAGVAHELNNPLSYVLSNLEGLTEDLPNLLLTIRATVSLVEGPVDPNRADELLREVTHRMNDLLSGEILERFEDALTGARRMRDITRGLSTFARLDEDQLVPVDVTQVVELAINMAHNEIKYRARVVKQYGRTPTVLAHEGRLCQVFVNLLTNAAHAIEEGDVERNEIRVTTWTQDDLICVAVSDTGSGIGEESLARLFEPFFTTKKIGQGSGLGLPISKNIVESYGGTLQVKTELGKGSEFTVRLPHHTTEVVSLDRSTEPPPSLPRVPGRILVVDDEEGMRVAITRILRGHEVVVAENGAEAIRILEQDSDFDLVLCDVMMSEVTGMDLHTWLLAQHPRLGERLIFMTGGAFTPRARAYLGRVANVRLEKPFDSADLRRIVNERVRLAKQL